MCVREGVRRHVYVGEGECDGVEREIEGIEGGIRKHVCERGETRGGGKGVRRHTCVRERESEGM